MAVCSNCHAEQPSSDITTCILCGYPVVKETDVEADRVDDESMDFVVTEANGDNRPFVGGQNEGRGRLSDDLGIETTTDLMQHEAERDPFERSGDASLGQFGTEPIGDSSPPTPPPPNKEEKQPDKPTTKAKPEEEPNTDEVKKLSEEEIKKIERNLWGTSSYLKEQEKTDLARKLDSLKKQPLAVEQVVAATQESARIQAQTMEQTAEAQTRASRRAAGVAYFYRNFIHVSGHYGLMTNDVITVNNRQFVLKPKKIKTPYLVGGLAIVFALFLIVLASVLAPGTDIGQGKLLGVVLDEYDRPYLHGATIHVTENDKSVKSDREGFFEAGMFPVGTYTVEYVINGHVVGTEQATVTSDNVRMLFLRPEQAPQASVPEETQEKTVTVASIQQPKTQPKLAPKTTATTSSAKPSTRKASKDPYGKVTLAASVLNAKLELGGSVLGAGNLTYSKIKTGKYNYKVSADGYQPAEGKLTVESGQNYRLSVNLKPLQQAQKAKTYSSTDYYHSGVTALKAGNYETAVSDLTQAIEAKPSYAEAYYSRGQAYQALRVLDKAYDDFIRSAEIYQLRKEYGNAITCYGRAIELDSKVVTAYIGRGNLYLRKGEELAAIADFDKARQLDKRSFQAYYGLGEARFKQQQYKKAIEHFKDARAVNSDDPLVYQYMMLSYMALADYKEVKKTYDKFASIVTDEQMNRFRNDQEFAAVIRVVESQ